jgi:hypothetical protein
MASDLMAVVAITANRKMLAKKSGRSQYRKRERDWRSVLLDCYCGIRPTMTTPQAATLFPQLSLYLSLSLMSFLLLLTLYQSKTRRDATARRSTQREKE